jgi:HSP20 family protein
MSSRDLFANFDRMRREVDELFGDVFDPGRRRGAFSPPSTSSTSATRRARSCTPSCRASTRPRCASRSRGASSCSPAAAGPPQAEGRLYQQIEIEHGAFRRVVPLGADVDAEAATARYRDGLLEVTLPLRREPPAEALGARSQRRAGRRRVIEIEGAGRRASRAARSRRRRASCRCATRSRSPTRCCRWRSASPRRSSSSTTRSAATARS